MTALVLNNLALIFKVSTGFNHMNSVNYVPACANSWENVTYDVCIMKTQISLGICIVQLESLLDTLDRHWSKSFR